MFFLCRFSFSPADCNSNPFSFFLVSDVARNFVEISRWQERKEGEGDLRRPPISWQGSPSRSVRDTLLIIHVKKRGWTSSFFLLGDQLLGSRGRGETGTPSSLLLFFFPACCRDRWFRCLKGCLLLWGPEFCRKKKRKVHDSHFLEGGK